MSSSSSSSLSLSLSLSLSVCFFLSLSLPKERRIGLKNERPWQHHPRVIGEKKKKKRYRGIKTRWTLKSHFGPYWVRGIS
jgi:hypothetical protein